MLLGGGIGDALGFLVEGAGCDDGRAVVGEVRGVLACLVLATPFALNHPTDQNISSLASRAHAKSISFLQYSDDTQMTREMIMGILERVQIIPYL